MDYTNIMLKWHEFVLATRWPVILTRYLKIFHKICLLRMRYKRNGLKA